MRKIDRKHADAYFKARTTMIVIYLIIGLTASYGVVFFARELSAFSVLGIPFHYYMGAQGAVVTFIILLFINAIVGDKIDEKFGFNPEFVEETEEEKKAMDH
ncbi:DUF4212 domain-containing protein [Halobacillus sp. Marseille-Q1614]|uniref:DUF4212 domain-containing protein n=1 Tax=Halobacillus sp. Marseille-Q1614 TaxID=2709134 RepID=UPI00156F4700|nr:sodium/substrate symporter small subunit [Halobacillus sp. Marseille-Q1614]